MEVFFIDYGNIEKASTSNLLYLTDEVAAIPPQAFLCSLDGVSKNMSFIFSRLCIHDIFLFTTFVFFFLWLRRHIFYLTGSSSTLFVHW